MRTFRLVVSVDIKAPVEMIYDILSDLESYPKMFRYLHDIRVVRRGETEAVANVHEDMFGILRVWVLTKFRFEKPTKVMVEQIRGPFVKAIGWFQLEAKNGGWTTLTHGAELIAEGALGHLGILFLKTGEARRRMTQEVLAVKRRAESDL